MARRTGIVVIQAIAKRMCQLVATWGATIQTAFPENTALLAALAAANAACALLVSEIEYVRDYGE